MDPGVFLDESLLIPRAEHFSHYSTEVCYVLTIASGNAKARTLISVLISFRPLS